jgi:[ribosomal protein S5]-alanine N-acetyltransferase
MKKILETERLILREFSLDDTTFIIELLNSPGWLEFIGDRNVKTEDDAHRYLENGPIKSYEDNGYGLCMVMLKDGTPIGMCGIINRADLEHPDIGFALLPQYAGKGYALEIAKATFQFAKDTLKIPTVLGITVPSNQSSIKLLERIGLKHDTNIMMGQEELMLFKS